MNTDNSGHVNSPSVHQLRSCAVRSQYSQFEVRAQSSERPCIESDLIEETVRKFPGRSLWASGLAIQLVHYRSRRQEPTSTFLVLGRIPMNRAVCRETHFVRLVEGKFILPPQMFLRELD